ncbi:MAG: tail fiber protein, partial [Burkholderiales bacterium]|nr:tail fiber protein [Bacteroidia bacterium]
TVASTGKALSVDINGDVVLIPSAANAWQLLGNAGTTAGTNFLGTTDVQDLVFKTNNVERARILASGNFGIGTPSPLERLHVNGNILANDGVYPQSSFNIGYSTASVMSDIFEPWTDNGIKFYDGNSFSHLHVEALGYCVLQAYSTGGSPKGNLENTSYSALIFQDKGGNVGVGTTAPAPSAIVDITSTSAGFAMPRMTTVQRIAIAAPIAGLQVYDTNLKGFYYYDGTKWDCANNPAGTVQYFANVAVPNGYLECNGQGVSATTYPELFAAVGYLYGGGGATFNVPDLRGEFVRGLDMGKGVNAGRVIGTNEAASTHRELGGTGGVGTINDWWSDSKLNVVTDGLTTSTPPSNGGQLVNPYINNPATVLVYEFSHRPRNVALLPCIKF